MPEPARLLILSVSSNPLLYIPLLAIVFFLLLLLIKAPFLSRHTNSFLAVSFLFILNYIFLLTYYSLSLSYFDHNEPSIIVTAWQFIKGHPVYDSPGSESFHNMGFGPMIYVISGLALKILGPNIFSSKITFTLSALLSVLIFFALIWRISSYRFAVIITGSICLLLQLFYATAFWCRPDPYILCLVTLVLLTLVSANETLTLLIFACALGLVVNLKIHSFLYFLPICYLLYKRVGLSKTISTLFGSAVISILPFVIFPQISFYNFLIWLKTINTAGIDKVILLDNLEWSIYLFLPLILLAAYMYFFNRRTFEDIIREYKMSLYIFAVCILVVIVIGAKAGSGRYHLIPFIPTGYYFLTLFYQRAEFSRATTGLKYTAYGILSVLLAVSSHVLAFGILREIRVIQGINEYPGREVIADLKQIMESYPQSTIAMGYGNITGKKYRLTFYRPVLLFADNPWLIEPTTLIDNALAGLAIPAKTIEVLRSCNISLWLIPKGEEPFQASAKYYNRMVFGEKYRSAFQDHYRLASRSRYFDIWACKNNP